MQVTNQRGAAPLEIGNEFLFHCYLFPVPLVFLRRCRFLAGVRLRWKAEMNYCSTVICSHSAYRPVFLRCNPSVRAIPGRLTLR